MRAISLICSVACPFLLPLAFACTVDVPISAAEPAKRVQSRDELVAEYRRATAAIPALRGDLDARVWEAARGRWTLQEAAKLLLAFHCGDGALADTPVDADFAAQLRADLARLRQMRALAYAPLADAAQFDAQQPGARALMGAWDVIELHGGNGQAAASLELYEPDPIGRKLAVADGLAAVYSANNLMIFNAEYPEEGLAVDFQHALRPKTLYRGRFKVSGNEATLRFNPINAPRPNAPTGELTDGGLIMRLRRSGQAPAPVANGSK